MDSRLAQSNLGELNLGDIASPSGTISPTGIASTVVFGTLAVIAGGAVACPSIPSTVVFGTASVTHTVSPSGLPSTVAFGSTVVTGGGGVVACTGLPSTLAFGTPTVRLTVSPTGIASTVAVGTPGIRISIKPTGIASTLAFGTASLRKVISLASRGIASTLEFGTPTILCATSGSTYRAYSIFLNGVLVNNNIKARSIRRSLQIGSASRGTCSFTWLNPAATIASTRPQVDDEVIIYEGTTRFFLGEIESTEEQFHNGTAIMETAVKCTGPGVWCDRRVVGKYYSLLTGGIATITIADIITNFLDGTGITYSPAADPGIALPEQLFAYCTATEAINQVCDKVDRDWYIDFYKRFYLIDSTTGTGPAPCTISDDDDNFDEMTVQKSRLTRRNRQGVRNSQNRTAFQTDSFTATAGQISFPTTYLMETAPQVFENGVLKTVVALTDIATNPYDYYYILNSVGIFRATPASGGETVAAYYPSKLPEVYWAEDTADIALHGRLEHVEEVRDVPDAVSLQNIASGILARCKVEPVVISLTSRRTGWEPGQIVTINTTQPLASGDFLIESVDSDEGETNTFFRHQIKATNNSLARNLRGDTFLARLIERSRQPLDRIMERITFIVAGTLENHTNPGLTVGLKTAVRVAEKTGVLREAVLFFNSTATTPTTSLIEIDVYKNGTSIFGTVKLQFAAGQTTPTRWWLFSGHPNPVTVAVGDIFTIEVLQADPLAMDGTLELTIYG